MHARVCVCVCVCVYAALGVHILFSGMFRSDEVPQATYEWYFANLFGATCHLEPNATVTHIVARRDGTEKVFFFVGSLR
jgi:hypothetical protein